MHAPLGIILSLSGEQGAVLRMVTPLCPWPLQDSFLDSRRKQTALLLVPFHYFSLQLSLHFRVHVSARDSILGFVGTRWFQQIGSSRNLSELVPLGLLAYSEGRRGSKRLPQAQCPRHVQTGGQDALFQHSPTARGTPHLRLNQHSPRLAVQGSEGQDGAAWTAFPTSL